MSLLSTLGGLVGLAVGGPGGAAIGAGIGSLAGGGTRCLVCSPGTGIFRPVCLSDIGGGSHNAPSLGIGVGHFGNGPGAGHTVWAVQNQASPDAHIADSLRLLVWIVSGLGKCFARR